MRLQTARLRNDHRLAYSPEAQLLVLVAPNGHDTATKGVRASAVAALIEAPDAAAADALISEVWNKAPVPEEQRTYASFAELASVLARMAGRVTLAVSAHEPRLPMTAYAIDPALTEQLCARDADCGDDHYWIWVSVGDDDFIFHFDWKRGAVVPPTPLAVVYG